MKILFIGGNGNISWWCVQKALEQGHEVYELNRGATLGTRREIQPGVTKLTGDYRNKDEMTFLLREMYFDVVCDFICYNAEQARFAVELFECKTNQFIFVSSCAVYKRSYDCLPFTEESCKYTTHEFAYAWGKICAEDIFIDAHSKNNFPVTIVRPAYTYDTIVPISIGHNCFTAPQWYIDNDAALIAGDGTNVFSYIHSRDFADAFKGLLGNSAAIGEAFHIASDKMLTWLGVTGMLLEALHVKNARVIHVPTQDILNMKSMSDKNMAIGFLNNEFACDRMWCAVFDNSKIKRFVPGWEEQTLYKDGIKETISWLCEEDIRRRINPHLYQQLTELSDRYG